MSKRDEFLAGERLDDVLLYLAEDALSGSEKIAKHGEDAGDGYVLVLDGEQGRNVFATATGMDAMQFAQRAMRSDGEIDPDLTGSTCPHADEEGEHATRIIFAFAEGQNDDVEGIYNEGDVIHAYAHCTCGATYSDRWVVGER